ncbi:cytochrome P450 [Streptosporangium longisporum]|uniref:Cytochrome P450 n=1 Tax=Streptosporangium longisporum TaxID=46187 RepID=A0ABP6LBB0_9ACTN
MTERAAASPEEAMAALLSPDGRRDPYPRYEALRAHGDLVTVRPGLMAAVGHAVCARALREPWLQVQDAESYDRDLPGWRSHSSLRGWTGSMLYTNPPDHTRLRRLVSGAFTFRRVTALGPAIERMTGRLLDRVAELGAGGAPVDFMREFAFRLPVGVIGALLGVPEDDQGWFRAAAADVTLALEGTTDPSVLGTADKAMDELSAYFTTLIAHRRREPADDLVSDLVRVHDTDGSRLGEHELTANLVLLLSAGFDTTTHLLGHGLKLALEHPDAAARLAAEPGFAEGYVEECLRFEPPVQATTRWAVTDADLLGTRVPAGTKVVVMLAAGNRDPRRFDRPDVFDPGRPDNQPLSFGGGAHFCLGAALARLEARIALPMLLRRFPAVTAAGPADYRDRWLVRGHDTFPVTVG